MLQRIVRGPKIRAWARGRARFGSPFPMGFLPEDFLLYVVIGFAAQLVDGALGMAYGVLSTSLLMSVGGLSPAVASANVHLAEVGTSAASGLAHARARNVDWPLFRRLAIPGAAGGVLGATLLSGLDLSFARPVIAAYLAVMGVVVIVKAFRPRRVRDYKRPGVLGFIGGFCDATGGGGWGPIVTTNLLGTGADPLRTVGTVNAAEFLMTLAASAAFFGALGPSFGTATLGLLLGGVVAAPIAVHLAGKVPRRALMVLVGCLIVAVSCHTIFRALAG